MIAGYLCPQKLARSKDRIKRAHTIACINISLPSADLNKKEDETASLQLGKDGNLESDTILTAKVPLHIFETDPARLELAKAEEARRKRHCDETLLALEKIQKRIKYTITEYEGTRREASAGASINVELVDDPNQLFDLLIDPTVRSKYHQRLTVFLMGYEEKHEELEGVLGQLQDFFLETQAGGTAGLLEKVEEEELDLDEATKALSGALSTAQSAVKKLVGIKKEMNQLMSIVAAYPNTNKGRKKMEKALLKAQEEVATFSKNFDEVETSLKESTEKCSQLQVQLDVKTKECTTLRTTADKAKLLQVGNDKLKRELDTVEKALKESREELSMVKDQPPAIESLSDKKRTAELESALEQEIVKCQKLTAELDLLAQTHKEEMEVVKAEYEVESNEVRGRFEDQLKSLMEEDIFGEEGEHRDSTMEVKPY